MYDSLCQLKYVSVSRLIKLLENLEPDMQLVSNTVGNIAIYSNDHKDYLGFIDFNSEQIDLND